MSTTVRIASVDYHSITFDQTVEWILDHARTFRGAVVCTPNVDYVVRARRDSAFNAAIASADLRVADGMGVIYAARIAGRPLAGTVTGRLLLPALVDRSQSSGIRIALYGAGPDVAMAASRVLEARYPGSTIVAAVTPPTPLVVGSAQDLAAVERLRAAAPSILFVALGAPKQEIWMQLHRSSLPATTLIGVGAAFDIVAGRFREAPPWMTHIGVEWFYRLIQEPRRLARRYLLEDPWIFLWALRTRASTWSRR